MVEASSSTLKARSSPKLASIRLEPEQMAELVFAALESSRRLFDDALLLQSNGRVPSAFALAGLSADELGKHIMAASFFVEREDTEAEWKRFWRRFRRHQEKLGNVLLGAWLADLVTEAPLPDIERAHQRRLTSTYVDVGQDGTIRRPPVEITTDELDQFMNQLGQELGFCESTFAQTDPEKLAAILSNHRDSALAQSRRENRRDWSATGRSAYVMAVRAGLDSKAATELAGLVTSWSAASGDGEEAL
jgi:AbiV family abortive infection protein